MNGPSREATEMEGLERTRDALAAAQLVVATTGAGMSKESGIPTFRDAQDGLWSRYDPLELATREGFLRDPARVWGWYNYRRGLISELSPHRGHFALAKLAELVPRLAVVTQNIDGLHQRAGSKSVLELHGNIHRFKCLDQDHPFEVEIPTLREDGPTDPPECERCGSPIRPDVVWFGELLAQGVLEEAEALAVSCDVMLVIGTSGIVDPAASLPIAARDSGATVVEINTETSELSHAVDVFLKGQAGELVPALVDAVEGRSSADVNG